MIEENGGAAAGDTPSPPPPSAVENIENEVPRSAMKRKRVKASGSSSKPGPSGSGSSSKPGPSGYNKKFFETMEILAKKPDSKFCCLFVCFVVCLFVLMTLSILVFVIQLQMHQTLKMMMKRTWTRASYANSGALAKGNLECLPLLCV